MLLQSHYSLVADLITYIAEFPAQPKTILVISWHLRPLSSSFVAVCHLCSHVCHTSCKRCGLCHYTRLCRQWDSVICISHNSTVYWFFCKHNFKHNWLFFWRLLDTVYSTAHVHGQPSMDFELTQLVLSSTFELVAVLTRDGFLGS